MRRHQITIAHLQQMRPHQPARQPEPATAAPTDAPVDSVLAVAAGGRWPKAVGIAHAIAVRAEKLRRHLASNAHRLTHDEQEQVLLELGGAVTALNATIALMTGQPGPRHDQSAAEPSIEESAPAVAPSPQLGTVAVCEPGPQTQPVPTAPQVSASEPQQAVARPAGLAQAMAGRANGLRRHVADVGIEHLSGADLAAVLAELTAAATDIDTSIDLIAQTTAPRLRTRHGQPIGAGDASGSAVTAQDVDAGMLPTT